LSGVEPSKTIGTWKKGNGPRLEDKTDRVHLNGEKREGKKEKLNPQKSLEN